MALIVHPLAGALGWAQYRRVRTSPDGFQASTGFRLAYAASFREHAGTATATTITTTLSLDPATTWVVASALASGRGQPERLLEHERLHWRIDIVIGKELDTELRAIGSATSIAGLRASMDALAVRKVQRAQDISDAYDDDTSHGAEAAPQGRWAHRVTTWETAGRATWP